MCSSGLPDTHCHSYMRVFICSGEPGRRGPALWDDLTHCDKVGEELSQLTSWGSVGFRSSLITSQEERAGYVSEAPDEMRLCRDLCAQRECFPAYRPELALAPTPHPQHPRLLLLASNPAYPTPKPRASQRLALLSGWPSSSTKLPSYTAPDLRPRPH